MNYITHLILPKKSPSVLVWALVYILAIWIIDAKTYRPSSLEYINDSITTVSSIEGHSFDRCIPNTVSINVVSTGINHSDSAHYPLSLFRSGELLDRFYFYQRHYVVFQSLIQTRAKSLLYPFHTFF